MLESIKKSKNIVKYFSINSMNKRGNDATSKKISIESWMRFLLVCIVS